MKDQMLKEAIKRDLVALLPEDTSDDLITRLSTYIVKNFVAKEKDLR